MNPRLHFHTPKYLSLAAGVASTWLAIGDLHAQLTIVPTTYVLPLSSAVTNKPGFIWNVSEVLNSEPNQLAWAEQQLQGLKGVNYADPNGLGTNGVDFTTPITTGPAKPANPPTAPISFVITNVINLSRFTGTSFGHFTPDDGMPGIPGTGGNNGTDNTAAEALTYLDLPVGTNTIGVNSDDGFRLTLGGATPKDQFAVNVGEFDSGRGSADTIFQVVIQKAGLYAARLLYENGGGDANVELFTILDGVNGTNRVLVNDLANGGIPAYSAVTVSHASAQSVDPAPNANNVVPNEGIHVVMVDGSTPLATNTIALYLDGAAVSPAISRNGNLTSVDYNPAPWPALSQHTVSFAYTDAAVRQTNTWSFVVQSYISLDPAWAVANVDTTKPGFNWNIFANATAGNKANSVERAEMDLTLQGVDSSGLSLANLADPTRVGAAIGPAAAPPVDAPNAPIHFEIAAVIQLDIGGCCTNMPGAPSTDGTTDGQAAEVMTYLNLSAGVTRMQIDADDGWRLYSGSQPNDLFGRAIVAESNGGAAGAVGFSFIVQKAGLYPFRLVWENGGGGSHLYWYCFTNSTPVFVNDLAHGGLAAYRAQVSGTKVAPYVAGTLPVPAIHQMEVPSTNLTLILADGTTSIDTNSITLSIDGKKVTPVTLRQANYVTVSDNGVGFPGLQLPSDTHTAALTYKDSTGTNSRSQQFSFNNIQVLILPTNPIVLENFDKYPVATSVANTVPPGWTAWNYTAVNTPGWDITSKASDSFKNWIIIDTNTLITSIESGSLNNIDVNQTINGQPVATFASSNVLWATSDGRNGVQAQFCTSAPFNLSSITNPVMIYSSIMRMSSGGNAQADGIEYSIDGGNTWFPAVIYVTIAYDLERDVLVLPTGDIDAVQTLNAPWAVLDWTDPVTGKQGGGTFGTGLAEPVSQALAPYMAPRSDNTQLSTKVDGVRLPMASRQKSVTLRFFQLGNCSWWWGVDNLAFYDIAPPVQSSPGAPHIDSIQALAGSVTIKWSNGGTLFSSPSLASPTWTTTGNSSGTFTEPLGAGAKFYRVKE